MSGTGVQDRCRGVLLGLAAGDRNGGPIRMAVRLAESLLELGRFDPADTVGRYLRWWREGAFDTGPVSGRALELVAAGKSASEASAQVHREFAGRTAGCNPAHRSSPLAMLASLADDDLPGCLLRGDPSVQIAVRPGRLLDVELVHLHGSKRLSRGERSHVPVQVTAAGQPHLQPVEAALPLLHLRLRAEAVFQNQEPPARL